MTVRVESNSYLTDDQQQVYQLRNSLERNGGTPGGFLDLLAAVVNDGTWRKIPAGVSQEEPFSSFAEFIEAKPPFGLGHPAEYVLKVLHVPHPQEGVPEIRERMDMMRAKVRSMLKEEGITGYTEEQRERDIAAWTTLDRSGGWWLSFFVACQVKKGMDNGRTHASGSRNDRKGLHKISASEFAARSGTSAPRVLRYLKAWEEAHAKGTVTVAAEDLYPGQEPIELPDDAQWGGVYSPRSLGTRERGVLISAGAEEAGIRPTKALEVAENPTALRVAIMADPRTAEAARSAIADLAVRERNAERVEYVRQVAGDGKVKTPAGQVIELPEQARERAAVLLAVVEDAEATPEAVAEAFETVQGLAVETVEADPEIQIREQRTRFTKTLSSTKRGIEAIDPDDLAAVADDELRGAVAALQEKVNELAELIGKPRSVEPDSA